eukprot:4448828-Prymnesium_polylepis.2
MMMTLDEFSLSGTPGGADGDSEAATTGVVLPSNLTTGADKTEMPSRRDACEAVESVVASFFATI